MRPRATCRRCLHSVPSDGTCTGVHRAVLADLHNPSHPVLEAMPADGRPRTTAHARAEVASTEVLAWAPPTLAAWEPGLAQPLSALWCLQKNALSTAEIVEALGLPELKGRKWHVQGSIATRCAPLASLSSRDSLRVTHSSLRHVSQHLAQQTTIQAGAGSAVSADPGRCGLRSGCCHQHGAGQLWRHLTSLYEESRSFRQRCSDLCGAHQSHL